jgi:hypothetical protein
MSDVVPHSAPDPGWATPPCLYRISLTEITGIVVIALRKKRTMAGSFEECETFARAVRKRNLLGGWWSIAGFIWTLKALGDNNAALNQLRALASTGMPAAAWRTDPSGRHAMRYFDGYRWTEHVTDLSDDPPVPQQPLLSAGNVERVASEIATNAHASQVDKAGAPYISHPARVAARLTSPEERAAAWLHDVLEDTSVTADELHAAGMPDVVLTAVLALTRRAGEDPDDYYHRVRSNPLALRVKLADLDDNSAPDRLALLDEPTRTKLEAKYVHARAALTGDAPA